MRRRERERLVFSVYYFQILLHTPILLFNDSFPFARAISGSCVTLSSMGPPEANSVTSREMFPGASGGIHTVVRCYSVITAERVDAPSQ